MNTIYVKQATKPCKENDRVCCYDECEVCAETWDREVDHITYELEDVGYQVEDLEEMCYVKSKNGHYRVWRVKFNGTQNRMPNLGILTKQEYDWIMEATA